MTETYRLGFLDKVLLWIAIPLIYLLGLTLRIKNEGRRDVGFPKDPGEPVLMSLWHETLLMSMWHHRNRNIHVLISHSHDGELIATVARALGYISARGSSTRGGMEGARRMASALKAGERGAITPDGPRGPRRELHEGVLAIARLAGRPILPFGFCAEHQWRLKTWDRFIIAKPFSRAVFVYGDPIPVPRVRDDDAKYLAQIQEEMDRVTEIAEHYYEKDGKAK